MLRHLLRIGTAVAVCALPTTLTSQQRNDEAYTEKILEFTTEPFFITPYVDHLPASETVPTPLDVLGHIAGAADVLSYPSEVHSYMRAVAAASPRVEVFSLGESEEGRELILTVVADEATIAELDVHKARMAQLADPRLITAEEAETLIGVAKPIYWATGAIHSGETGSPEMLMELVYRLAVEETPFIQSIRDNLIFMTTPITEVDGRAKQVDLHEARRADPDNHPARRLLYWGKYVAHDNNRDGIGLSLALSQHVNRTFHEYHPIILHDLHESAPHLYTSTGRGPYNAWFDPIVINEWNNIAYQEVREMTAMGVPGVYTHDFYDGWAPNYMFSAAHLHNAIGRFYETQGAGNGSNRIVRNNVEREWHRPNTPLKEVVWSIRNNVNLQQSALLIALNHVAEHKEEFLRNFYRKGVRSIAKATAEGPAAYVFPADDDRPGLQRRLLSLLRQHGIEVHRATEDFEIGDDEYHRGSFVIRMDQPYSRAADMLLDKQYYNPNDPRPYDDVGWTLGPLFDVTTIRVEDPAILQTRMEPVDAVDAAGSVDGRSNAPVYAIKYDADNRLTAFRFAHPSLVIHAVEEAFEAEDHAFNAGSFVVRVDENGADLPAVLERAAAEFGFTAVGLRAPPDVPTHPTETPRVAVVHTWTTTQSEGWLRIGLDEYGVPYDYISVHDVRDAMDLRGTYDVLIMGPTSTNALSVVHGLSGSVPMPWKRSELTPNLGFNDETDDMRGGLELRGVMKLAEFVEAGGLFITLTSSSSLPIHFGLAQGISIRQTPDLWARGGVFRVNASSGTSPVLYGYDRSLGVYFNTAPVFGRGTGGRGVRRGAGSDDLGAEGSTTARHTGRGGVNEEDIPQGRRRDLGRAGVEAFRAEHTGTESQPSRSAAGATRPTARTLMRFERDVNDLLISGGIRNGQFLANAPALVDAEYGDGHVLMFAFNPFWRGETLGSYALVFNALMHYKHLSPAPSGNEVATGTGESH